MKGSAFRVDVPRLGLKNGKAGLTRCRTVAENLGKGGPTRSMSFESKSADHFHANSIALHKDVEGPQGHIMMW